MLLSATDLIKQSIDLYRKNLILFLEYSVLMFIPPVIAGGLGFVLLGILQSAASLIITIVLTIIGALVSFWFSLAFLRIVAERRQGESPKPMKIEIQKALELLWPAILASILAGLAVVGGLILLIIPGIIFSIWFAFTLFTVVLDGKKGTDALRESKNLVGGRWWGVLWRILLPGLLYLAVSFVVEIPFEILYEVSGSVIVGGISTLVSALATIVLTPYLTAVQTILYLELKKTPVKKIVAAE